MSYYKCIGRNILPAKPLDIGPSYCHKCGHSLKSTCFSCDGTGKNGFSPSYCSDCGSKIENRCGACGGSGKTNTYHNCF